MNDGITVHLLLCVCVCVFPLVSNRACQALPGQRDQKESLVHRFPFYIIFQYSDHTPENTELVYTAYTEPCTQNRLPINSFSFVRYFPVCTAYIGRLLRKYMKVLLKKSIGAIRKDYSKMSP